mgnify:CR=1 FL=1
MSQGEIEKEISSSIYHPNLEFFQCRIWASSFHLKKLQEAKSKEVGPVATVMLAELVLE